jgi:hypothetical protein
MKITHINNKCTDRQDNEFPVLTIDDGIVTKKNYGKERYSKTTTLGSLSGSEREYSSTLPSAKSVYKSLAHKKSDSYTDCHCDHSPSDINTVAVCSDASCLRKSRLITIS